MHEVAGPQVAITGDHRTACGDVLERVLSDVVASLKQNRTPVEVDSMAGASISFCVCMPHYAFRVPSRATKS